MTSDTALTPTDLTPTDLTPPDRATRRAPAGHPRRGTLPGAGTYVVLALWAGAVLAAIAAGGFAGGGAARLALPAAVALPLAAVALGYRTAPRFRTYLLALDLRLVLAAQLWRVIGIAFLFALAFERLPAGFAAPAGVGDLATGIAAGGVVLALGNGSLTRRRLYAFTALGVGDFLVAFATGLALAPPALTGWPLAIFPTLMVPFFAVLHLVAVLQSRRDWDDRVHAYTAGATAGGPNGRGDAVPRAAAPDRPAAGAGHAIRGPGGAHRLLTAGRREPHPPPSRALRSGDTALWERL
jgi:hypothetical protein